MQGGSINDIERMGLEGKIDLLSKNLAIPRLSYLPQERLLEEITRNTNEPYKTFQIDTTTVQSNSKEFGIKGGVFQVIGVTNDDLTKYINVRFNTPQASPIRFALGDRVVTPFNKIFVDWPAQTGITFTIGIGFEFDNIFRFDKSTAGNLGTVSRINEILNLTDLPSGYSMFFGNGYSAGGGASPQLLYTVTAGKTARILTASIYVEPSSYPSEASIAVYDASDVYQYTIGAMFQFATARAGAITTLENIKCIPIPATYKIKLRKKRMDTGAESIDPYGYANVCGYEY